jgi:hypothetical protein
MGTRIIVLIATALAGCAHSPSRADASVTIELDARGCLPAASPDVVLRIRNTSAARIAFPAYNSSGPPYKLYPGSVQLLAAPLGEPWQVVLEHFMPASHEVALGAGDQADFAYEPSVWPSGQETGLFKLRLRDTQGRFHYSSEQGVCHPGSAPNNSFKPTPLRGAA